MTTNVLVANKNIIALLSDRNMTLYNEKTHSGVRKIYKISNDFSGGIMINGNMDFEGIPLKSLITEFSKSYDFNSVGSISNVKDTFIDFLALKTGSTKPEVYLEELLEIFKEKIEYSDFHKFTCDEFRSEIPQFIKELDSFENEFDELIPNGYDKKKYNFILWKIFSYYLTFEGTGIIFAGYNRNQFFPSFVEINIHFNNNGNIIHEVVESVENTKKPIIRVYANNEEAYSFLSGVGGDFEDNLIDFFKEYNEDLSDSFSDFLNSNDKLDFESKEEIMNYFQSLMDNCKSDFENFIINFKFESVDFIAEYTENLPITIICNLSVLLIVLTSIKQKITPEIESVGSDVDVAIIEPFKEFKWVKN